MKPYLRHLLAAVDNPLQGRHLVREYLQARILRSLQGAAAMIPLAFHSGTALRFLYDIPRYSEDLDFALERRENAYDFRRYLKAIEQDMGAEGYQLTLKYNVQKAVNSAFVRFQGLLHELELSPHADAVIAIKIEVDTRPPAGAMLATTVVERHARLHLQHHDPASLLTGKLIALLGRTYSKGRDLFDLAWYLNQPDWPNPNLAMLNHGLAQINWGGPSLTVTNWCEVVAERLEGLDWEQTVADVAPFIMDEGAITLEKEVIQRQLQSRCET